MAAAASGSPCAEMCIVACAIGGDGNGFAECVPSLSCVQRTLSRCLPGPLAPDALTGNGAVEAAAVAHALEMCQRIDALVDASRVGTVVVCASAGNRDPHVASLASELRRRKYTVWTDDGGVVMGVRASGTKSTAPVLQPMPLLSFETLPWRMFQTRHMVVVRIEAPDAGVPLSIVCGAGQRDTWTSAVGVRVENVKQALAAAVLELDRGRQAFVCVHAPGTPPATEYTTANETPLRGSRDRVLNSLVPLVDDTHGTEPSSGFLVASVVPPPDTLYGVLSTHAVAERIVFDTDTSSPWLADAVGACTVVRIGLYDSPSAAAAAAAAPSTPQ